MSQFALVAEILGIKSRVFYKFCTGGRQTQQNLVPFILMPVIMPGEVFMKNAINKSCSLINKL